MPRRSRSQGATRARFDATDGLDPIFRPNDGSNSPNADVSTVDARRAAYSMLLNKGVIRIGIGIPDDAEFELADVDDPYGFASARELSLFRRPLPSAMRRARSRSRKRNATPSSSSRWGCSPRRSSIATRSA